MFIVKRNEEVIKYPQNVEEIKTENVSSIVKRITPNEGRILVSVWSKVTPIEILMSIQDNYKFSSSQSFILAHSGDNSGKFVLSKNYVIENSTIINIENEFSYSKAVDKLCTTSKAIVGSRVLYTDVSSKAKEEFYICFFALVDEKAIDGFIEF